MPQIPLLVLVLVEDLGEVEVRAGARVRVRQFFVLAEKVFQVVPMVTFLHGMWWDRSVDGGVEEWLVLLEISVGSRVQ